MFYCNLIDIVRSVTEEICFYFLRTLEFCMRACFCLLKAKARTIFIDTRKICLFIPLSLSLSLPFPPSLSYSTSRFCFSLTLLADLQALMSIIRFHGTEIDDRGIRAYALKRENSIRHFEQ